MKVVSWNVNGIRSVVRKGLLAPFLAAFEDADAICLQETKAARGQVEVDVAGYHEHWSSAERKGYSGTAIFTKSEPLQVDPGWPADLAERYRVDGDAHGDANTEGRLLMVELDQLFVVTVYTPNAKDDLSRLQLRHKQWDPAFLAYMQALERRKPVVFCGDLNVAHTPDDLANPKPNAGKKGFTEEERAGFQSFLDAGFVDTFRLFHQGNGYYSWWSHFSNARARNVGWRIDYVLVSASLRQHVTAAEIHPEIMGSDHCPVSVTLDL